MSQSPPPATSAAPTEMTAMGRWMALTAALLGWLFDGAEMGLFSMIGRSAIQDLMGGNVDEGTVGFYFGVVTAMFLVGAATGGVLFGWLGDRIGRVRAMSLSVVTYALFTGFCGLVAEPWQIAVLRFIAALGMGGEWALGVSLVMEVWPNRSRALMAGLIGAAANVGYLLVGIIGLSLTAVLGEIQSILLAIGLPTGTVKMLVAAQGWRILMMLGAAPALLTFFFRLFVPESEKWQHERGKGTTSHWATQDLWGVLIGALGPSLVVLVWALPVSYFPKSIGFAGIGVIRAVVSVIGIVIASVGYTYPVVRFLRRLRASGNLDAGSSPVIRRMLLGACLSGVALMGTWGAAQWAPTFASKLSNNAPGAKEWTQMYSAVGAIVGTIGAALLGDLIGRRGCYALLCVLSFGSCLGMYQLNTEYNQQFLIWAFLMGTCTAAFYGWLPLYLPELFGTKVRATGQGFGFNFGRILAAVGTLQTGALVGMFTTEVHTLGLTFRPGYGGACSVTCFIYFVGLIVIAFAPETKGQPLPE